MRLLQLSILHLLLLINLPHTFGEDITLSQSVEGGESDGEGASATVGDPCVGHDCPEGEVCQVMINHRLLQMPVAHCVQSASSFSVDEGLCQLYSLGSNVMNCRSESQWRRVGENQCHLRGEGGAVLTDVQVEHVCHRHHSEFRPKFLSAHFMCCPTDEHDEATSPPSSQADISPSTSSQTHIPMDSPDTALPPDTSTQASTMIPQPTLPPSKSPQKPGSITSGDGPEASTPYPHHPQPVQDNHYIQLLLSITLALILVISVVVFMAIVLRYKYCYNIALTKTMSPPRETAIINHNSMWREEGEDEKEKEEEEVIWEDKDTAPILSPQCY